MSARVVVTDSKKFVLTGYVEMTASHAVENIENIICELPAILTFIQQQHVIVTYNSFEPSNFPKELSILASRTKGGELVINDHAKKSLLNLLNSKLGEEQFISSTDFKTAFFRNVEILRLSTHFVDITYYFYFSGIEALARCSLSDYDTKNVAQVITPFLGSLGFSVTQSEIEHYAHVRNALFHYGHHSKTINKNGNNTELSLFDFEDNLMRLFPDVLLKVIGFDDGHINWNRWKDLMAFC